MTNLDSRFDEHAFDDALKVSLHQLIRGVIKDAAAIIDHECPDGREKSLALTKLEESMFWAHASIARNGVVSHD